MQEQDQQAAQIRAQAKQLKEEWTAALPTLEASPSVFQPYLPTASLSQVTEAIDTLTSLFERARAPSGFAPMFQLARSLAATSLVSGIAAVQAIHRGEYAFFANLLVAVNQMASALHSMLMFGSSDETREAIASLGGKLAESMALVDTAQRELAAKSSSLSAVEALSVKITQAAAAAPALLSTSEEHLAKIAVLVTKAEEQLKAIDDVSEELTTTVTEAQELVATNSATEKTLAEQRQAVDDLFARTKKQQELIAALLPQAASAGLASSFALRVDQLQWTKRIWIATFIASVGLLSLMGLLVHTDLANLSAEAVSVYLLRRLPIVGPLIWLGWFSAVQYGNTIRIQEDYAFKEATSKAFEGYRDHLEHLGSVNLAEGNTAMTLLAARTIEVLSHEPMRVFGKAYTDASPASSVVDLLAAKSGKE